MNDKRQDQPSRIGGLLAAIMTLVRGDRPDSAPIVARPNGKHRSGWRPVRLGRFVRTCPRCEEPLRRWLRSGLRTDRYFDKATGQLICTACAGKVGRP